MLEGVRAELNFSNIAVLSILADIKDKKHNRLENLPSRDGEIAIVTGGGRGIGLEAVKTLLECKYHVILGVRNVKKTEELVSRLTKSYHNAEISIYHLDVSSMKSVKEFADVVKTKHSAIQLLVNNAGILRGDYNVTEDGFERQFATNYVGHFLLTHLLMENLKKGGNRARCSRIVNVSSCMHYGAEIDFQDIHMKKWYNPTAGYSRSKLAQLMFTRYLNKLLEMEDCPVRCYASHPGIVGTDMFHETSSAKTFPWLKHMMKTPKEGSIPILHCCLSNEMENKGGAYISNGKLGYSTSYSKNEEHQKRLFEVTCNMLNVEKFGVCKDIETRL